MARHKSKYAKNTKGKHNRHHILFKRIDWEDNVYTLTLRNQFVFYILKDKHISIHEQIPEIPVPPMVECAEMCSIIQVENKDYYFIYEWCEYLARICNYRPFCEAMIEQAAILKGYRL